MGLPKLPLLLQRKIYKTGQTRGADDDVIYQNRVLRNSTVLIPYSLCKNGITFPKEGKFENEFIVLISPSDFFNKKNIEADLKQIGLKLGNNALVFYETREQWNKYNPEKMSWVPAEKRIAPLGGCYIARVPATTAVNDGDKIIRGFTKTTNKGAGIRFFEYANSQTIRLCQVQLEALFWLCSDSFDVTVKYGMKADDTNERKKNILNYCNQNKLLDYNKLFNARLINKKRNTVCPLCLEELKGDGFFSRMEQAIGREVPDLTVTQINLFHIEELRAGLYNHKPYNLGWGHHHCNVVTKDTGIKETLLWMSEVLERNRKEGH